MVLAWLEESSQVEPALAAKLRAEWVEYIDAVDIGARKPEPSVPCLPSVVGALCEQAHSPEEFDARFDEAVAVCSALLNGLRLSYARTEQARAAVGAAMALAEAQGTRVMVFDQHYKWKRAYFEQGGAEHPTDYALLPDGERWQLVAIPPVHDSFDKKRPLPEAWAGLVDDELSKVVGVPDARFCHKNRFIAVFGSRESAFLAIERWGLARR
jgi:uncharacterized UPF0160 family protein